MTRFRSLSLLFAAAVLSVAVACADEAGDSNGGDGASGDGTPTATAPVENQTPETQTPDGQTPETQVPGTPTGDQPTSSDGTPGTGTPSTGGGQDLDDFARVEAPAPIEEVDVLFLESFPVQHRLRVVSGLPSGCAAFEGIEVERDGTTFTVTVTNTVPAPGEDVACTAIYGFHESTVELGSDLDAGAEYTVNVNDETITFVAQ